MTTNDNEATARPVSLDVLRARNLAGPLDDEARGRLNAVIENPCDATWQDAHSLIVNGKGTTLWQAVCGVDFTFPTTGPVYDAQWKRIEGWAQVPDRDLLLRAIHHAVRVPERGLEL